MKISYDFSFLPSARIPRSDKKIGQSFLLSYLNSQPYPSYIFRYKPYSITSSWKEYRWLFADKLEQHSIVSSFSYQDFDLKKNPSYLALDFKKGERKDFPFASHLFSLNNWAIHSSLKPSVFHQVLHPSAECVPVHTSMVFIDEFLSEKEHEQLNAYAHFSHIGSILHSVDSLHHQLFIGSDFLKLESNNPSQHTIWVDRFEAKHQEGVSLSYQISRRHQSEHISIQSASISIAYPEEFRDAIQNQITLSNMREITNTLDLHFYSYLEKQDNISIIPTEFHGQHGINSVTTSHVYIHMIPTETYQTEGHLYTALLSGIGMEQEAIHLLSVINGETNQNTAHMYYKWRILDTFSNECSISNELLITHTIPIEGHRNVIHPVYTETTDMEASIFTYHRWTEGFESESSIIQTLWSPNKNQDEAISSFENVLVERVELDSLYFSVTPKTDGLEHVAMNHVTNEFLDRKPKESTSHQIYTFISKISQDANIIHRIFQQERFPKHSWVTQELFDFEKIPKVSWPVHILNTSHRIDRSDIYIGLIPMKDVRVEKFIRNSSIIHRMQGFYEFPIDSRIEHRITQYNTFDIDVMTYLNQTQFYDLFESRAAFYTGHRLFDQLVEYDASIYQQQILDLMLKENLGHISDFQYSDAILIEKKAFEHLLALSKSEKEKESHSVWMDIGTAKISDDTVLHTSMLSEDMHDKDQAVVSSSQSLTIRNKKKAKVDDQVTFISDQSAWEDIWNRYSKGVDVLDPPDSDYDYSQLAKKVYDEKTGVPYHPLSPTNVPDVKVSTPLHHPLPEHFHVGLDDGKRIVVDNAVIIEVILAIESLRFRNKLRYAGMSASKTITELFSNLYQWIQGGFPNDKQFERMFRFARWYAEHVLISISNHILHREYSPFKSKLHTYEDLGIPYTGENWRYSMGERILVTTDTTAKLTFQLENYIDGQVIFRGYFDNPLNQGTMIVRVDGAFQSQLPMSYNGPFTLQFDIPQGNHTYELEFIGASGRVALSSMEVSGCVFEKAWTTTDESDTNGLKAVQKLIDMLLRYYELHHDQGKSKGTMAIYQRKAWNNQ